MIQVKHVVKKYGLRTAVNDVSFDVEKGTVLGFLGPNGAGKTTTIRIIAGYLTPTSGSVTVNETDVGENPVLAQKQIGYMPENTPLYDEMTVAGFLSFIAEIRGFTGQERARRVEGIIEECMLQSVRHQPIETLSKGYRRRTCLAQTLLHDPSVLLLDEPTEGLDPNQKKVVRDMIGQMAKDKIIMLSTHVLEEVEAICSRVMIISEGQLKVDSNPSALKKRSESFNRLRLEVVAPAEQAAQAFGALPDVENVIQISTQGDKQILELVPKDKQSLAVPVIEMASKRHWLVTEMRSDPGRLDDVFRQITTTADVIRQSA